MPFGPATLPWSCQPHQSTTRLMGCALRPAWLARLARRRRSWLPARSTSPAGERQQLDLQLLFFFRTLGLYLSCVVVPALW
jgi:hypothetical protein